MGAADPAVPLRPRRPVRPRPLRLLAAAPHARLPPHLRRPAVAPHAHATRAPPPPAPRAATRAAPTKPIQ